MCSRSLSVGDTSALCPLPSKQVYLMTAGSAVLLITYYFSPQLLTLRIFAMDRDLLYFFLGVGFLILYLCFSAWTEMENYPGANNLR